MKKENRFKKLNKEESTGFMSHKNMEKRLFNDVTINTDDKKRLNKKSILYYMKRLTKSNKELTLNYINKLKRLNNPVIANYKRISYKRGLFDEIVNRKHKPGVRFQFKKYFKNKSACLGAVIIWESRKGRLKGFKNFLKNSKVGFKKMKTISELIKYVEEYFENTPNQFFNPTVQQLFYDKTSHSRDIKYYINIKVTSNNVFCVLCTRNETLFLQSAGKIKIKVSQKKLKHVVKLIIIKFFHKINEKMHDEFTSLITISSPKNIKRRILRLIRKLKRGTYLINLKGKKAFNGCRVKKKRRKRGRRFRVYSKS